MQADVEAAIELVLGDERLPTFDAVRSLVCERPAEVPQMAPLAVDLASYDELLVAEGGR
jgi:hypothetical protein